LSLYNSKQQLYTDHKTKHESPDITKTKAND